jgi:hypothetical protein
LVFASFNHCSATIWYLALTPGSLAVREPRARLRLPAEFSTVNHADITIGCKLGSRTRARPSARCPGTTAGTGRFNLAQGIGGAMTGVAASTSIALTGLIFDAFGRGAGFLIIGGVAAAATAMVWMLLPETKPEQYQD